MNIGEAKTELKNYRFLSIFIKNKIEKLSELEDRLCSLKSSNDEFERVDGGIRTSTVEKALEQIWDTKEEVAKEVAKATQQQEIITNKIKQLSSPYSDILFKRYIMPKNKDSSFEKISYDLCYNYYLILHYHKKALELYADLKVSIK